MVALYGYTPLRLSVRAFAVNTGAVELTYIIPIHKYITNNLSVCLSVCLSNE